MPTTVHDLPFLAPIPRDHEVLVATFATTENRIATAVLDRTASILYCPEDLWGPLYKDPVLAVTDPVAALTRWTWTLRTAVEGSCVGALVAAGRGGEDARTRLVVEARTAPYR